jgi:hypothetical protein
MTAASGERLRLLALIGTLAPRAGAPSPPRGDPLRRQLALVDVPKIDALSFSPSFALMTVCIVIDAFNDQGTRKILLHACALHFKCNNTVSSSNVVFVFSGFHHSVFGSNKPEMDDRIR